jgi:hypothetical protein
MGVLEERMETGVGLAGSEMDSLPFYLAEQIPFVIEFDEVRCMDLIGIFSSVITLSVRLPRVFMVRLERGSEWQ